MSGALALALCALAPALVGADSFTPVTLSVSVARVARLAQPLRVTVHVGADAGVLDLRDGALVVGVKLAPECGGDYEHTAGTRLLHLAFKAQPDPGEAFAGAVSGFGRPSSYGVQQVCVWLEDSEQRVFAHDDSSWTVDVSRPCTSAARRYDRAARARSRSAAALKRAARRACGPGVPL